MKWMLNPIPLDLLDQSKWPLLTVPVVVVDVGNGESTLVNAGGRVRSWQPGGTWEDRDPGSAGNYERCVVDGHLVTFWPDGAPRPTQFAIGRAPN